MRIVVLLGLVAVACADLEYENPDSDVVVLTSKNFDQVVNAGDTFVKFYAPWCGHCKHFAPVWDEIATEVKGMVTVAKLDATADKAIANEHRVKGYPTLMFFHDGKGRDYSGPRTKEAIVRFCKRVVEALVTPVSADTHKELRIKLPASFLLLCPEGCGAAGKAYQKAAFDFADQNANLLSVSDAVLAREYSPHIGESPQLVRWRVGDKPLVYDGLMPSRDADEDSFDQMVVWMHANKFPMVSEIKDGHSFSTLAKQGKYMVLGVFLGEKMEEGVRRILGRAARKSEEDFAFALLDADQWDSFVARRFGSAPLPRVVVLDGDSVHFEDPALFADGTDIDQGLGALLARVLSGDEGTAMGGFLAPMHGFWGKFKRFGAVRATQSHPIFIALALVALGLVAQFIRFFIKELFIKELLADDEPFGVGPAQAQPVAVATARRTNNKKKGKKAD